MKLGKFAKEREKRILRYLYEKGSVLETEMQTDLYKQSPIDIKQPLADLLKMRLVRTCKNSFGTTHLSLTKKGRKYAKKRLGVKKAC